MAFPSAAAIYLAGGATAYAGGDLTLDFSDVTFRREFNRDARLNTFLDIGAGLGRAPNRRVRFTRSTLQQ